MKAMQLVAFGDPPVFEEREVPDPRPGPSEVVIALRSASLNRRDPWVWKSPGYCALPVTLGSDGAGVVVEVGRDVATPSVGDEVVIYPALGWGEGEVVPGDDFDILGAPSAGTFAGRVVVAARCVHPRPQRLSWQESGALPLAALTAWRAVFTCARVEPSTKLLVIGAGGGVATYAVQMAVAAGAEVAVTTGSAPKAARLIELGAAHAALYSDESWQSSVTDALGPLDVVIDSFGDGSLLAAMPLLRRGGAFVSFGDTGGASAGVDLAEVYWQWRSVVGTSMGSPEEFAAMLAHVASAQWRPVIDSVFPLSDLALAAERLGAPERFGKVVIDVAGGRP